MNEDNNSDAETDLLVGGDDASEAGDNRCPRCEKVFATAYGLRAHEENGRCRGAPSKMCPRCRRTFETRQAKHAHVRRASCTPAGTCTFMCENADYVLQEASMQVLAGCAGPCDRLVTACKLLWANGEHPENHNVRLKSGRRDVLEVCKSGVWYDALPAETFDRMVAKAHAILTRDPRLDASSMYEMPDVGSALFGDSSVDLSGMDERSVAELREREAEEHGERQARELRRHLEYVRAQKDQVYNELLCMVGSEEFKRRSGIRHVVLRTKGICPFDEVDERDADRIMEHPNNPAFTADECVRIHAGADDRKHSVFPSLDGRVVRVRTKRGWVPYRREYFAVLVFRKVTAVMEERGYGRGAAVWDALEGEMRERSGPSYEAFVRTINKVLDCDLQHVRWSVVEEPARLE